MIAQPPDPTARDLPDWEKDRLAWNLPRARPAAPPAWARLDLDVQPRERELDEIEEDPTAGPS